MLATSLNKLRWSYRKNTPDIHALVDMFAKRNFPAFMFESHPQMLCDEIPVFTFHSVEPDSFEETLQFIRHNDYRTLSGEEFSAAILGKIKIPKRSIVLTFDDGRATLWSIAFPLLKKYDCRAVSFIIPGYIPESAPATPNYNDFIKNQVTTGDLLTREKSSRPLCSWEEIQAMHASGVIDFQSHTMYHHQTYVSQHLVDFIHPGFEKYFFGNINALACCQKGQLQFNRESELGTPVYRAEPRMHGRPQFFDDERLRNSCIKFVAKEGGDSFFLQKAWRKKLLSFYRSEKRRFNDIVFETVTEQYQEILDDLKLSKKIIEDRLLGKVVTQLCYPWFMGSELAVRASREAGYKVNYWGMVPNRATNRLNQDLFYVPRLEDRYILRLPGDGRKSWMEILKNKLKVYGPALLQ